MTDGKQKLAIARAWRSASGKTWRAECPFCGLYHQHGVDTAEPEDDIVRTPDCPLPWHQKPDYRLVVQGQLTPDMQDRIEKLGTTSSRL